MSDKPKKDAVLDEGWVKIGGQGSQNTLKWDYENNTVLIGKVKNKLENVGPNASKLYEIENADGIYGVWGSAALDRQMMLIEVGNIIKIVYLGKQKNPGTGRTFKNFEIFRKA